MLVVGVGALATQFMKARRKAKEFQDLINEGGQEDVQKAYDDQFEVIKKIEEQLARSNKRSKTRLFTKLEEEKAELRMLEGRLKTLESEEKITEAKKKQNEENKKAEESLKKLGIVTGKPARIGERA